MGLFGRVARRIRRKIGKESSTLELDAHVFFRTPYAEHVQALIGGLLVESVCLAPVEEISALDKSQRACNPAAKALFRVDMGLTIVSIIETRRNVGTFAGFGMGFY